MNGSFTSLMNPVKKIAALIREKYLDVLILVDAVSCMADDKIEFNA
jgi:aspartate aminotransferase-like enzyme